MAFAGVLIREKPISVPLSLYLQQGMIWLG